MNWKKAIRFGLLLWVIMFAIVSAMIGIKLYDSENPQLWVAIVIAVLGGVTAYILAGRLSLISAGQALGYGLAFAVVGIILDAVITMRFAPDIFKEWTLWFGYALIVIAPLPLTTQKAPSVKTGMNATEIAKRNAPRPRL